MGGNRKALNKSIAYHSPVVRFGTPWCLKTELVVEP